MIIYHKLLDISMAHGSRIALQYDEITISYAELTEKIEKFITWTKKIGVKPGESVAVMCHSRINQAVLYFAASYLEIKLIYINFIIDSAEQEWKHVLEDASPDWVMCEDFVTTQASSTSGFSLVAAEYQRENSHRPNTAPIYIQTYTSGTTGRPKGVCYREESVYVRSMNVVDMMKIDCDSKVLITGHMFNMTGLTLCVGSLLTGATLVFLPSKSHVSIPQQIQKEKITHVLLFPYQLANLVHEESLSKEQFASLKLLAFGTAPTSSTIINTLRHFISCEWLQGYGSVETCGPITWLTEEDIKNDYLATSVGRPAPNVHITTVGRQGESLLPNSYGEIVVESPDLMLGYWDSVSKSIKSSGDSQINTYLTGDIGYIDAEGYLFLKGRSKDCILLSDGYTLFSSEVENIISKLEGVIEVAVVGCDVMSDGNEIPVAFIYSHHLELIMDNLHEHLRLHLAIKKWPQEVIFLRKAIPRNINGKMLKNKLKSHYAEYAARNITIKMKENSYV
jgi:acyl-CoA synthetase (AMP-forming)/AMP-acid ligase II